MSIHYWPNKQRKTKERKKLKDLMPSADGDDFKEALPVSPRARQLGQRKNWMIDTPTISRMLLV